jgi:ribosomal protein L11 methyltransferase
MDYMELHFKILDRAIEADVLIAQLAQMGYESFEEREQELLAYIPTQAYSAQQIDRLSLVKDHPASILYRSKLIKDTDWNSRWERSYTPVVFPGKCIIRAPFHPKNEDVELDIIIEPRMAFGTAHHDTTRMMVQWLLDNPPKGLSVLDMGCGTGILAILAAKLGAHDITAIDNDHLAFDNAMANAKKNNADEISVYLGDANLIAIQHYDLIMANINRNTLVNDMPFYSQGLRYKGMLAITGFYGDDLQLIVNAGQKEGLTFRNHTVRNDWVMALFEKHQQAE